MGMAVLKYRLGLVVMELKRKFKWLTKNASMRVCFIVCCAFGLIVVYV